MPFVNAGLLIWVVMWISVIAVAICLSAIIAVAIVTAGMPDHPKCQGEQREAWIQARESELLPVPYFHVVFTLPEQINTLCLYAPAKVYRLLSLRRSDQYSLVGDAELCQEFQAPGS